MYVFYMKAVLSICIEQESIVLSSTRVLVNNVIIVNVERLKLKRHYLK